MDSETIPAFAAELELALRPHRCPQSHRYGRSARRVIFFLGGLVLVAVGVWSMMLTKR